MGYIDKYIDEGNIQIGLAAALASASANWSVAKTFYKAAFDKQAIAPERGLEADASVKICVARHVILANSSLPNSYLGIATVGDMSPLLGTLTKDSVLPKNSLDAADNVPFADWIKGEIAKLEPEGGSVNTKFFSSSVLYFYMLEKLPTAADNSYNVFPFESSKLEQACLDIECWKAYFEPYTSTTSNYRFVIREPDMGVLQSPISKCATRFSKEPIEDSYDETYDVFHNYTNWWFDSKVSVKGYIDDKALFVILQADTTPAWEDNIVPSIPLYFGLLEPFKDESGISLDYKAVAFFAGTAPDSSLTEIPAFDFDNYDKKSYQSILTPILKQYPRHPSNGVDTVMVQRARKGARYQANFLSWNTTSDDIAPDRSDRHSTDFTGSEIDRDYPRAWMHSGSDEYMYWFNPSRYSGKIHTSKIYVMHPEEGLIGSLYHAIGMSSVGIAGGKIRVLVDPCGTTKYQYYRFSVVDGISPLTKRPGTVYRPIGLGILDDTSII